jgi:hypothetical protein
MRPWAFHLHHQTHLHVRRYRIGGFQEHASYADVCTDRIQFVNTVTRCITHRDWKLQIESPVSALPLWRNCDLRDGGGVFRGSHVRMLVVSDDEQ